jgi:uncharacterized protein YjiK
MKKLYIPLLLVIAMVISWITLGNKSNFSVILLNSEIAESSGITFYPKNNSLFVVEDEGTLFELNLTGEIIRTAYLGDFDLEGITIDMDRDILLIAVEGIDSILEVSPETLEVLGLYPVRRKYRGITVLEVDESRGLEGIVWHQGEVIVVNQSDVSDFSTKVDHSAIAKIERSGKIFYIVFYKQLTLPDASGLSVKGTELYLLHDKSDEISIYDLHTLAFKKLYSSPVSGEQEGITFDSDGNMYLAIEESGVYLIASH